jgi:hypothetical protein
MPALNLSGIKDVSTEIPIIPAGIYEVRVVGVDTGKARVKEVDLEQIKFRFQILEGDQEGRKILHGMSIPNEELKEKAEDVWEMLMRQWKKFAIATGQDAENMETADFFGLTCRVQIGQRTKDGKTYDMIKEFLAAE